MLTVDWVGIAGDGRTVSDGCTESASDSDARGTAGDWDSGDRGRTGATIAGEEGTTGDCVAGGGDSAEDHDIAVG